MSAAATMPRKLGVGIWQKPYGTADLARVSCLAWRWVFVENIYNCRMIGLPGL